MGMLIIFSSFGDIVSLYIPRKLKNFPLPTHTLQISSCWIAQYYFIYCSSSGSLVMGMFVILISLQWDFVKSFTSLSCISGLDSPGIGPSLWKRFAKRMFLRAQLHQGCWKIGLKQMSAMLGGHSAVLMLNVPKPVGRSSLSISNLWKTTEGKEKNHVNLLEVLIDASIKG